MALSRSEANAKFTAAYNVAQEAMATLNRNPNTARQIGADALFREVSTAFSAMWAEAAAIPEAQSFDYADYGSEADKFRRTFQKIKDDVITAARRQAGSGSGSSILPVTPPATPPGMTPPVTTTTDEGPNWLLIGGVLFVIAGVSLFVMTRPTSSPVSGLRRRRRKR